jgi:adenylate cyclase
MPDDAVAAVRTFLTERGVPLTDIHLAEVSGSLTAMVLDQMIMPGVPAYTADEAIRRSGDDPEVVRRLWGALGFPDPGDGVVFYQADLVALNEFRADRSGWATAEDDINNARASGAALSRLAETNTDTVLVPIMKMREQGATDAEIAAALLQLFDVERIQRGLFHVWRRQWQAAVWRRLGHTSDGDGASATEPNQAVGFVDLVRFTALTEQVAEDELTRVVSRFEELSHEVVVAHRGRVVKMIGDAVMYVSDDATEAVLTATGLVEAYADDDLLPPARAGIASGPMLARGGDYFGPVVNLASRIVDVARPNSVVCSEEVHDSLAADDRFDWRRLPRMKLKGIGWTTLWRLRHDSGSESDRPADDQMPERVAGSRRRKPPTGR